MNQIVSIAAIVATLAFACVHSCPNNIDYDAIYDLRYGWSYNNVSRHVQVHQALRGYGCSKTGVLKINLNNSGPEKSRVLIDMEFDNPTGWTFNLGGSPTNNGWAGDASTTEYDAEIHPSSQAPDGSRGLRGYRSDVGLAASGTHQAFDYPSFFKRRLTMIVGNNNLVFLPDNHNNFNYNDDTGMFNLAANNDLYLGINKVISGRSRIGSGLCRVSIKLLDAL